MLSSFFRRSRLTGSRLLLGYLLLLAAAGIACNEYYIPPPDATISIDQVVANLGIPLQLTIASPSTTTSNGTTTTTDVQTQTQFSATVQNSSNNGVTWSIENPNGGADFAASSASTCSQPYGCISPDGVYTAPPVLPSPSSIVIRAIAQVAPNPQATATLQLIAPVPQVASSFVVPATTSPALADCQSANAVGALSAGSSYEVCLTGNFFYPNTAVSLGGANVSAIAVPATGPNTTAMVQVTPTQPGLLGLKLTNATPGSNTGSGTASLLVEPATAPASSALAVLVENVAAAGATTPSYADVGFVPRASANSIDVVNLDSATALSQVSGIPAGFNPSALAADQATNQLVAIGAGSTNLLIIDAGKDQVSQSVALPVTAPAVAFSDNSCQLCSVLVDAARGQALVDTSSGYFVVSLAQGSVTAGPISLPVAENFTYDPAAGRLFDPYYANGSGLQVETILPSQSAPLSFNGTAASAWSAAQPDAAAWSPQASLLLVSDEATGNYSAINLNGAITNGNVLSASFTPFSVTTQCTGAWDEVTLEPSQGFALLGNEGNCLAVASIPSFIGTNAPASLTPLWAQLGSNGGVSWTNIGAPHGLATYIGLDGLAYGLALRSDTQQLLKVNLSAFVALPAPSSPLDSHQVDPTGSTALTYITLQ